MNLKKQCLTLVSMGLAAVGLSFASVAEANLISNGDFSANAAAYATDPGYDNFGSNPAVPTSWGIASGNRGVNGTGVTWTPGNAHDVFGPTTPGSVQNFRFLQHQPNTYAYSGQSFIFAPNTTYQLDFDYAGRRGDTAGWLGVVINDGSGNFFDTRLNLGGSDINVSTSVWQHQTFTFTTTAGATNNGFNSIIFTNEAAAHGLNFDNTVDFTNVSLTPEPSSLAMLAFGSMFLSFVKGRRNR